MHRESADPSLDPEGVAFQVQKVFIKNIDPFTPLGRTETDVHAYFSGFGEIIDFKVLQNRELRSPPASLRVPNF